ncbi:MAG TPA: hypothetical protein VM285_00530 [Polyangia bacterium]|nr:hypothetical protein [Polyangia bacterium]
MVAIQFEKTWVAIGQGTLVTGFLKADLQIHLVKVLGDDEGELHHWAAIDDAGDLLFETPSKLEAINWIEAEVGDDAIEVSYWNEYGKWVGLPTFSGSPGKTQHLVARARRRSAKRKVVLESKPAASMPRLRLAEQIQRQQDIEEVEAVAAAIGVTRGWRFD